MNVSPDLLVEVEFCLSTLLDLPERGTAQQVQDARRDAQELLMRVKYQLKAYDEQQAFVAARSQHGA